MKTREERKFLSMKSTFFFEKAGMVLALALGAASFLLLVSVPTASAAACRHQCVLSRLSLPLRDAYQASDGENSINGYLSIDTTPGCLVASVSVTTTATDGDPIADIGVAGILFENGKAIDTINGTLEGGESLLATSTCNTLDAAAYYTAIAVIDGTFTDDGDFIEGIVIG
jgi:hypothetical protein